MYISIEKVLDIWEELLECKNGTNGFGGYTAEIYAYRLISNGQSVLEPIDYHKAAKSLVMILDLFSEKHNVSFEIDGVSPNKWIDMVGCNFDHRCHVTCINK